MPSRIVRDGILTSLSVNSLSPLAELFYRRLMSVVDDYGRYFGHPSILRAGAFPLQIDRISESDIVEWLGECSCGKDPLVEKYEVNGTSYIQISKFGQRVRSAASKFPDPPTIRRHSADNPPSIDGAIAASTADNPPLARAESESETYSESESEAKSGAPPPIRRPVLADETFAQFEAAYREAKPDVMPDDFSEALFPWRLLSFEQQVLAVQGVRRRVEYGIWRPGEPHFITPPAKYLKSEWKREVLPPVKKISERERKVQAWLAE